MNKKSMRTGIIWIIFLFTSPAICIAQDGIYKIIDPLLKGDIDAGCIIGTDRKGEIKSVLIPRSIVLKLLTDTSGFGKKPTEHLPPYSQRGSSNHKSGKLDISNIIALALERFDIRNDSIDLLELHKESLSNGNYAASLLKEDAKAMNRIKEVIERDFDSYDRISLVSSLIYADSGIIQTGREKSTKLKQTSEWVTLVDSTNIRSDAVTMKLVSNSPVLYSGNVIFEKPGYNYKAFIPFGIDNILDKQYAKGVPCLLVESLGIGGFFYFKSEQDRYKRYAKSSLDDDKIKEYNRDASNMKKAKWGSIACTGLIYLLWDCFPDLSPKERNKSSRDHSGNLKVMPYSTLQDSGLALSFNF
jgi:hypothetical protein